MIFEVLLGLGVERGKDPEGDNRVARGDGFSDMLLRPDLNEAVSAARARVKFAFPWWLRPFLMRGVVGITLGRRIYLAPGLAEEQLERFIRHELTHVRQIARHGLLGFYWRYIVEYVRNRRHGMSSGEAYRSISFEMEALAAEKTYNLPTAAGR